MLGDLTPVAPTVHIASVVGVGAAAALWVRLQSVVLRLRASEEHSRWASNARDFIGFLAAACLAAAFALGGLPWAASVLFAGTVGVLLELFRYSTGTARLAAIVLPLVLAVAVWPSAALAGADQVTDWLMHLSII